MCELQTKFDLIAGHFEEFFHCTLVYSNLKKKSSPV